VTKTIAIILLAGAACAADEKPAARLLGWMDSIAQQQLDRRAATIAAVRGIPDAEKRKEYVRAKLLELIGGLPDYSGPLNAKVTGRIDQGGYVIEKLYFESLPKLYVTANLYRPSAPGRYPGVLFPLGHWEEGKPAVQQLAGNLALKGFVVLVYDPLGQGERLQAYDPRIGAALAGLSVDQHFMAGAQALLIGQSFARYRIWDAKRALDYLLSRPEVEGDKIGCTGCSGGGTVSTYISALDPRIKVAAPACYITSFRLLFKGSVGDSEQSLPNFLSSGLDLSDYVELFAPKPWLISSTIADFFPLEGARQAYEEARRWYRIYGSEDKIAWKIGPGEHGTPVEIREAIYAWFIRWLKDGKGDPTEQKIEMHPDFELRATATGQVATEFHGRDIDDVLREEYRNRKAAGTPTEMMAALAAWSPAPPKEPANTRVLSETRTGALITQQLSVETEHGLELDATLIVPRSPGRKPGVLVVETAAAPSAVAMEIARTGAVVLALNPRGKPAPNESNRLIGDWAANTRAWLIGRNMPGLRAFDIRCGIDLLASRADVDPARVKATAQGAAGVSLLIAAALDERIKAIWLDRTPWSLRAALDNPVHRDLHDAVLPGFALRWDLSDMVKAIEPRRVVWSDPSDWMGAVQPLGAKYLYRTFESGDGAFIEALLR
jgi:cephalosporin-C deacetylase-like acetyl esterase